MPQVSSVGGGGNGYYGPDVHIRFKTNGSTAKREFFNFVMCRVDLDYPFIPDCVLRQSCHRKPPAVCPACGGKFWQRTNWGPEEVKKLSRQINGLKGLPGHFGLRIKRWEGADKCPKPLAPLVKEAMDRAAEARAIVESRGCAC